MSPEQLRAAQQPLKEMYRESPEKACQTLKARGSLDLEKISCRIDGFKGTIPAGLHPSTGGDTSSACSVDLLLQALVGCAGVTLSAVATSMGISIRGGQIEAEGDLDFRGTLGVDKSAPIGLKQIRLKFELESDAEPEQISTLICLTERYCVVFQTLRTPPTITSSVTRR
jgi:uncharacterized OsmC-like protein